MKHALFVYNPVSGGQKIPHELDFILAAFQERGILVQPYRLMDSNNEYIVDTLKTGKYDFVIASGGDGTINFIANILLDNGINMALGVIPSGTCNDFARCLGIYSLKDSVNIILGGKTTRCDVGYINNSQYFLSTFAGGNFVDVSFSTDSELKKNFGPFAYYLKGLSEIKNIQAYDLKVEADGQIIEGKFLLFLIINGKEAAGLSNIVREADLSDGLMDIILIKKCSNLNLASIFFKVLNKESFNSKNVIALQAKQCKIQSSKQVPITMDGEKWESLPAEIEFKQQLLEVFIP